MTVASRRIRVGFDMTLLQSNTGGSGVYARGLLAGLEEREDLDMRVLASSRGGGAGTLAWMLSGARASARSAAADIFHSPGFVIPYRPRVPLVITIHDLSLAKIPQDHPLEWRLYYQAIFPRLVRSARAVITPTDATRRDVIAELQVNADRVTVTPYGIADRFFDAKIHDDPETTPTILFSGPPIKRKNLDGLLRAFAQADGTSLLGSARLRISGAAEADFPAYAEWIREHGLEGRVEWMGLVPSEELPGLYASSTVFAYPSFLEGFGFPPLEAMAAGTPVVSSSASCLPEVLGDAALLVDPYDDAALAAALEKVLSDSTLRARLTAAGREWSRRYTWSRCAELTAGVYQSIEG